MYFLLTDNILNPADMKVLHWDGTIINDKVVEHLSTEYGIDNFQALVCLTESAALSEQDRYLAAYYPDE